MKLLYVFILLLITMLAGCGLETKTLPEFYDGDLGDVTKIMIVDGSTGHQKVVDDKGAVAEFLGEIKEIKFIPDKNQEKRVGWRYGVRFYEGDKETFQFSLNQVDGDYYYTQPDIFPIVDEFYNGY